MGAGPRVVLDVVAGVTALNPRERRMWADAAGFVLNDYGGLDTDERRTLAPAHVWCMCIEPGAEIREYFLSSIDVFAVYEALVPQQVAEILRWLEVTGTDPRAEVDYVETLTEIVERTGAMPQVALTPERAAPFVDVLRGITSASPQERTRAAGIVPDLLPDLRREEQWCFTGVLARAVIVEEDRGTRSEQLRVLVAAHHAGAVHDHDRELVVTAQVCASGLTDDDHRALATLRGR